MSAPGAPTITSPVAGAVYSASPVRVEWTVPAQVGGCPAAPGLDFNLCPDATTLDFELKAAL